jgi:3',5'-cyclic AMP phosphodiesterase CpdA
MCADVTFIQLSDLHLLPRPGERVRGADPLANLRRVLARVAELEVRPDFYLISGDLANDGEPASYALLREIMAPIEAAGTPVLLGLGNHDSRPVFRREMLDEADGADGQRPYYYSRTVGDLRVVMLDSVVPGQVAGALDERQLAWLAAELARPAPGGSLIVLHHPILARGVRREGDYLLANPAALEAALASRRSLGVLTGHLHMSSIAPFAGTLTAVTPAVAFQFDPGAREGERILPGAGFTLGSVRDGTLVLNPILLPGE